MKYLVKQHHVPVNTKDKFGNTPLADAIHANHKEAVEYLTSMGGVAYLNLGYLADSSMYQAAVSKNAEELKYRMKQNIGSVNELDYDMRTPLHLAAAEGHEHIITLLLNAGASVDAVDRWGHTPRDDAFKHHHAGCVKLLSEHSQLHRGDVHVKAKSSISGLENEKQPLLEMNQGDSRKYGTGSSTESHGARSNSLNAEDRALLHASDEGDIEEVKRLIRRGANINARDYDDRSVLHLVCTNGHLEALQELMKSKDLVIDVFDRFGSTPFKMPLIEDTLISHQFCEVLGQP